MAVGDFDTYYSDNPWATLDKNQRTWYDPDLMSLFRQKALFTPTIQFVKNLADQRATSMVMSQLLDPHPDTTALAVRQIWMPASHIDSREVSITFSRYGGKVAYTNYDDLVTYWKQNNQEGIRQIMRGALGQHMVDVLDLLARNAYIQGALTTGYALYEGGGDAFNDITTSDLFSVNRAMDIWLGMTYRNVASALGSSGAAGSIICYTTPGVIYDIQKGIKSDEWINVNQYANPQAILRYEVGSYKQVRFVQSPRLVLWNAGTVIAQGELSAAVTAGDGALINTSKVDGVYKVGQTSGITPYLQVKNSWLTGSIANISVGDIVTIHLTRTSDHGVTNGVDPFEGTAHVRRVVAKTDSNPDRITLDLPIMIDMNTDLGSGVYGYITKGRNIHSSIFVGGPQGIVSGVARAPRLHAPPPVDDFEMVQRFSWDAYMGYQPYAPEVFEVVFSAGSTRVKGETAVV
jgi:N4-gp56 family major capsid protein